MKVWYMVSMVFPISVIHPVDFVVSGVSPTTATFEWRWVFGSTTYKLFIRNWAALVHQYL